MNSIFVENLTIHTDWEPFLTPETRNLIFRIEKKISTHTFTPPVEKVLRFFEVPLNSVSVIILGQDPYPQPGVATGRAFEVGTLKSWNEPFKNISLKNIIRALYKSYTGNVLKFNELKTKFDNEFPLLPPNKLFGHWEKQGVLLLNTSFTCETGKPGSHKLIWEEFTIRLLNFINTDFKDITWFLWGNHALQATEKMNIKNKIITQHPMMCYDGPERQHDFLFGNQNCFEQLKNKINWTGFNLKSDLKTGNTLLF
jgi:uracil-DNA glycosylase